MPPINWRSSCGGQTARFAPNCGETSRAYFLKAATTTAPLNGRTSYRRLWKCAECRKQFSVLVGTTFEATHFPLAENVPARIYMTNANKNGVTALELHRSFLGSGPGWTDAPFLTHGAPATLEGAPSGSGRQPVGPSDTQADSA
jgi:hypothetical protein